VDIVLDLRLFTGFHRSALNEKGWRNNKPVVDISFPGVVITCRLQGLKALPPCLYRWKVAVKWPGFLRRPLHSGEEISRLWWRFSRMLPTSLPRRSEKSIFRSKRQWLSRAHGSGDIADLALLIHYLAAIGHGKKGIRFTTLSSLSYTPITCVINAYAEITYRLANHLHLPVQEVVQTAFRLDEVSCYTASNSNLKLRKLHKVRPRWQTRTSTDIIVVAFQEKRIQKISKPPWI